MIYIYAPERGLTLDWNKIKAEYIAGGTSYRRLAEKYGIERNRLQKRATAERWVELRSRANAETESKIIEAVSRDAANKAKTIDYAADRLIYKICEMIDCEDTFIDALIIQRLTSALKDLKEIKGYKSELDIKEQEARIRTLEQRSEQFGMNGDDKQTGVLILPAIIDMPEPAEDDDGQ